MTPKLLFVEDMDDVRNGVARMLARRFDVRAVATAEEAVRVFDREGPFPVVLTDYGLPGMDGMALLAEVHRHAPETMGVLLTGIADVDLAVSAVHASGVFRFLTKPCGYECMVAAVEEALSRHHELREAGDVAEELLFERDALASFRESLEERAARQGRALTGLQSFSQALCGARSIQEIVSLAARTTHAALGRGVHVQVWDDALGATVVASAGPEMSARLVTQPLAARERRVGEVVVDAGAGALAGVEQALLSAIASVTAVTAYEELRRRERSTCEHPGTGAPG
ncbi:MAG: response regulator [Planctomycetes bacterium]|nr:response regulator [Planctomycetota bacterium]